MPTEETKDNSSGGLVLAPGEGKKITVGPNTVTYKLRGEHTGGAFSMIEYSVAGKFEAPSALHYHTKDAAAIYVLEGTFGFQLGECEVLAPAGSVVLLSSGLPFKWWNAEDRPARYLAIYFPAGFEKYFEEVNEAANSLPPGPLDMEKLAPLIKPIWEKYGIAIYKPEDK
ncbi:MAG TPA: cupin domain-containing protein [Blastocatellia bacterium]|nr:cupin domain-containing protein [Blastocatellia bacterium]